MHKTAKTASEIHQNSAKWSNTERAHALKASKAEIEASFYEYLTSSLTPEEAQSFALLLDKLYNASMNESRAGFPHLLRGR